MVPRGTSWRLEREASHQGAPSFGFTFLFPWVCGCCADFKLHHQESLLWSDFSFPNTHTHTHTHTNARTHTHTHRPASGLCQALQVMCWLENRGVMASCEFCSFQLKKEKVPSLESLSTLYKPEWTFWLHSGEIQKSRRSHKRNGRGHLEKTRVFWVTKCCTPGYKVLGMLKS